MQRQNERSSIREGEKLSVNKETVTRYVSNLWEEGGHFKTEGSEGFMEAFHRVRCGSRQPNIIFLPVLA